MLSARCWSSTQRSRAPSRLPRWTWPVGLMPETTRVMAGEPTVRPSRPTKGVRRAARPGGWTNHTRVTTLPPMAYDVQTEVFEGPFDLLLHLLLNEQVDLYEVSLCRIVDAYLVELERMDHLDLEVATEFLLIAATLVELKARRLLPGDDPSDLDEELALWEER